MLQYKSLFLVLSDVMVESKYNIINTNLIVAEHFYFK